MVPSLAIGWSHAHGKTGAKLVLSSWQTRGACGPTPIRRSADLATCRIACCRDPADEGAVDLDADIVIKGVSHRLPLRATVAVLEEGAVRVSTRTSVDRHELGVSGNLLGMLPGATELSADAVLIRND